MNKKKSDEFDDLVNQGYSLDSPEMIKFFEKNVRTRTKSAYNRNIKNSNISDKNNTNSYSNVNRENDSTPRIRTRAKAAYNQHSNTNTENTNIHQIRTRAKTSYNQHNNISNEKSTNFYNNTNDKNSNITRIRTRAKASHSQYNNEKLSRTSTDEYTKTNNYTSKSQTRSKANTKYYNTSLNNKSVKSNLNFDNKRANDYSNPYKSNTKGTDFDMYDNSKFHIVIDPRKGNYSLLNNELQLVDTIHKNRISNFFLKHFYLNKFKKQLDKDYRTYKKLCKKNKIPLDSSLKKINEHIKYCLSLCPDADYQILELLRNNIGKVAPSYGNYQTACAQYLHELAVDFPYPSRMPFDLNYACDVLTNHHRHIASTFGYSDNPVDTFRKYYLKMSSKEPTQKELFKTPNTEFIPPKKDFEIAKHVKAPINYDLDR